MKTKNLLVIVMISLFLMSCGDRGILNPSDEASGEKIDLESGTSRDE